MAPVLVGVAGQVPPPLHDEHARVADVATPRALRHLEAGGEGALVLSAVCESGAASRDVLCNPSNVHM